ncbi:hypothetical protein GH714_001287 [Hevea brasiliensis]|uniref:Uncharacterized protein n=1 Tax=Hevea brasiliensis TaxID=3981 RepID=A0A6A6M6C8_HEVBR|nr:hypothetical protein GH714_001287 [Hevea brasiliensis]
MRQLNVLLLNDVKLDGGYEDFPKHLVCLRWLRFPLNSMPTCLNVEKLVVLDMRMLPDTIADLKSLEELHLTGCSELKVLPKELAQMESLKLFFAGGITLNELSFGSRDVRGAWSWLSGREGPESTMFSSAFLPRSLTHLILPNCNLSDGKFTTDLHLPSLRHLVLRDNPFNTISAEIAGLPSLEYLDITQCNNFNVIIKVPTSIEERNLIERSVTRLLDMVRFRLEDISSGSENRFSASILQNVVQLVQSDCPHLRGCFIVMNNNVWCRLECVGDGLGPRVILQENTSGPLLEGLLAQNLPLWDMHKGKLVEADKGDIFTGSFLAILRVFIESLKLNEILMEKATMRFLTMDFSVLNYMIS